MQRIVNQDLERSLKYIKDEYGIGSIEQLKEEMRRTELDIGAFTMPFKITDNKK